MGRNIRCSLIFLGFRHSRNSPSSRIGPKRRRLHLLLIQFPRCNPNNLNNLIHQRRQNHRYLFLGRLLARNSRNIRCIQRIQKIPMFPEYR